MKTLPRRHRRDEFAEARAEVFAAPPRPADAPAFRGNAADVLTWLREQDTPIAPTALRDAHDDAWLPASVGIRQVRLADAAARPLPGRDTIQYLTAVSVAIQHDHEQHMNTLRIIDEIRAAAPDTHTLTMALAPVVALLAEVA